MKLRLFPSDLDFFEQDNRQDVGGDNGEDDVSFVVNVHEPFDIYPGMECRAMVCSIDFILPQCILTRILVVHLSTCSSFYTLECDILCAFQI